MATVCRGSSNSRHLLDGCMRGRGCCCPKQEGASLVWTSDDGHVALLLGGADNAAAVLSHEHGDCLNGLPVIHIICVSSPRIARGLSGMRESRNPAEDAGAASFKTFSMADCLPADAECDFSQELAATLAAIHKAVEDCLAQGRSSRKTHPQGVLVHCDVGHNRSPAVVLAYLVFRGYTLRQAYRLVLGARSTIDPLPTYRRALRAYEAGLTGKSTVQDDEPFAMHVSELVATQVIKQTGFNDEGADEHEGESENSVLPSWGKRRSSASANTTMTLALSMASSGSDCDTGDLRSARELEQALDARKNATVKLLREVDDEVAFVNSRVCRDSDSR